jgi:hypothetical protein
MAGGIGRFPQMAEGLKAPVSASGAAAATDNHPRSEMLEMTVSGGVRPDGLFQLCALLGRRQTYKPTPAPCIFELAGQGVRIATGGEHQGIAQRSKWFSI